MAHHLVDNVALVFLSITERSKEKRTFDTQLIATLYVHY